MNSDLERLKSELSHRENALPDYELKMRDFSVYPERIEVLEADSLYLRNHLSEIERILEEKGHILSRILNAIADIGVDSEINVFDPTTVQLESKVAAIMGKEAGLFVPSGTMGNLISVLVHCDLRGSEVILGDNSHIHIYENGGISTLGGVHPRPVKNDDDGTMDIRSIEAAIRDPKGELVYTTMRLICLENSHANTGGRRLSLEYTNKVGEHAKKHGLKLHIDGARIFNASVALEVPVNRLVQAADSVSVCLSKGLGAPVGLVIVGTKSFISKARGLRKILGGGMRQFGFICAAAFVALKENIAKLEGDHKKAKMLAEGLNQIKCLRVNVAAVETNIIYFDIFVGTKMTAEKLNKNLEEHGVLLLVQSHAWFSWKVWNWFL